jgi:hypothetical protein
MAAELCLTGRRLIGLRRSLAGTFEGWRPVAGFRSCNLFTPKKKKKKKNNSTSSSSSTTGKRGRGARRRCLGNVSWNRCRTFL